MWHLMDIRAQFFSPVLRVQLQKWIFQAVSKAILIRSFCALHRMTENLPVDVQMPALDSSDSFMSDCSVPFLGAFIGVSKLRTAFLKRYLEHRTPCSRTELISRPCLGSYIPVLKYSTLLLCMLWWLVNIEVPFWEGFKLKKCFQSLIKKRFKNNFRAPLPASHFSPTPPVRYWLTKAHSHNVPAPQLLKILDPPMNR